MKQHTKTKKKKMQKDAILSTDSTNYTNYAYAGFAALVLIFSVAALVSWITLSPPVLTYISFRQDNELRSFISDIVPLHFVL